MSKDKAATMVVSNTEFDKLVAENQENREIIKEMIGKINTL